MGSAVAGLTYEGRLEWSPFLVTAACFPIFLSVLRRILPKDKNPPMRMTAMEDGMARCDCFPPSLKLTQINNIINGFTWFDECPSVDDVWKSFEKCIYAHKRFRAIPRRMRWEFANYVDKEKHVTKHNAATEADAVSLLFNIANSEELPQDRPLWKVEVVEVPPPGRSVVLIRILHTIGDGIGLFELMLPLLATDSSGQPVKVSLGPVPKPVGL